MVKYRGDVNFASKCEDRKMFSRINSVGLFGLNAFPVTVESSFSPGQPNFDIVGMPDIAVQESKARIRAVSMPQTYANAS